VARGDTLPIMVRARMATKTIEKVELYVGTYKTVTGNLSQELQEGRQILRITITGANCNLDKLKLICTLNTDVEDTLAEEPRKKSRTAYNLNGVRVGDGYKGIVVIDGRKVLRR